MQKLPSILLVDDDSTSNFLTDRILKRFGVTDRLLTAEDGDQALEIVKHMTPPDEPTLILLDVKMPVMGGLDFLKAYRELPASQRGATVIIIFTIADPYDLSWLNGLHIDNLVTKPLTKPLTEEKLRSILQLHFQRTLPSRQSSTHENHPPASPRRPGR